jgi:hypothetical protein
MKATHIRFLGLLIAAPVLFGAKGGCGANDKVVSMGGNEVTECVWEDCKPAIGIANWECVDGGTGGPVCTRQADGNCGWKIVDCPPAPTACDQIPQCQFPCGGGMKNPIDEAGCTHTCECVPIECSAQDCGPALGMPNWQCPDGTTAGPSCSAGADGVCAWRIVECPPVSDPCTNIPGCDFACPPGTKNPVDERGCTHTCQCVACSKDEIARGECGNVPDLCANKACGAGCRTGTRVNAEACTKDGQCEEANYASCTCTSCKACTVNGCTDP